MPRSTRRTATTHSCLTTRATTTCCGPTSSRWRSKSAPGTELTPIPSPSRPFERATSMRWAPREAAVSERRDLELIAELVPPGSRVLDLGCGDGELLAHLTAHRSCTGYGVEIADA